MCAQHDTRPDAPLWPTELACVHLRSHLSEVQTMRDSAINVASSLMQGAVSMFGPAPSAPPRVFVSPPRRRRLFLAHIPTQTFTLSHALQLNSVTARLVLLGFLVSRLSTELKATLHPIIFLESTIFNIGFCKKYLIARFLFNPYSFFIFNPIFTSIFYLKQN